LYYCVIKSYFVPRLKTPMNKVIRNVLIIVAVMLLGAMFANYYKKQNTKKHSPQDTLEFINQNLKISMVYCRPYKKGRLVFGPASEGALQPFGKYWRLGANEATTIETNKTLAFGKRILPAGKYSIYAIPGKESWLFGINEVYDRWGLTEPDYSKDVFKIEVPIIYTKNSVEQFTISIERDKIVVWWDTSKAEIPFEVIN